MVWRTQKKGPDLVWSSPLPKAPGCAGFPLLAATGLIATVAVGVVAVVALLAAAFFTVAATARQDRALERDGARARDAAGCVDRGRGRLGNAEQRYRRRLGRIGYARRAGRAIGILGARALVRIVHAVASERRGLAGARDRVLEAGQRCRDAGTGADFLLACSEQVGTRIQAAGYVLLDRALAGERCRDVCRTGAATVLRGVAALLVVDAAADQVARAVVGL